MGGACEEGRPLDYYTFIKVRVSTFGLHWVTVHIHLSITQLSIRRRLQSNTRGEAYVSCRFRVAYRMLIVAFLISVNLHCGESTMSFPVR